MQGLVFKKLADKFWVKVDDSAYICVARKNLKDKGVFVGDRVEIDTNNNPATIEKIADRKNIFIRPPLCNLDVLVITLAQIPEAHQDRLVGRYAGKGYKQLLIDNYVVVFKIDKDSKKVFVVTVQYQGRNI